MSGKPYRSLLVPYEEEIFALRGRRPPVSYAQIAELLEKQHGLRIQYPAIFKFVKVRSRWRRSHPGRPERAPKKAAVNQPPTPRVTSRTDSPAVPEFDHTYSDRYNLKRLPKDVAAAIRRKLEAEGH